MGRIEKLFSYCKPVLDVLRSAPISYSNNNAEYTV